MGNNAKFYFEGMGNNNMIRFAPHIYDDDRPLD